MYFDALTLSALVVTIIILIFIVVIQCKGHKETQRQVRRMARQTMLMQRHKVIMEVCHAIHDIDPSACPGVDFVVEHEDALLGKLSLWHKASAKPEEQALLDALKRVRQSAGDK